MRKLNVGKHIGYIVGAGDKLPQSCSNGYENKFLNERDVPPSNLKQFDAL